MTALELVKLTPLIDRAGGSPDVRIGLIDGPVAINHPELASDRIEAIPGNSRAACIQTNSAACVHGTFVAGILSAKRGSIAPAVCPNCTLMVRPIFTEITAVNG